MRELLEELYGDLLAVQEEVELAAAEGGQDVRKSRARTDRAETLYLEAEAALEEGNHAIVKAKTKAARAMVDGAGTSWRTPGGTSRGGRRRPAPVIVSFFSGFGAKWINLHPSIGLRVEYSGVSVRYLTRSHEAAKISCF
ncbi:hypothetical protein [Methanoculleus chikugoensis]|uniref:hypothetical protein n=1 Tax=Methanoculleus chikugoensis TaxID=118126 RepID=UPI000A577D84|nr:hypothetical protein [Methanoculleus chikugoensis]